MVLHEPNPAKREALARLYTFYAWPVRPAEEAALARYADVILGIHRGEVVTAYDITDWRREKDAERQYEASHGLPRSWPRIVFEGTPSATWAYLIGTACPAPPPGQWPIRYVATSTVARADG